MEGVVGELNGDSTRVYVRWWRRSVTDVFQEEDIGEQCMITVV
jgi:hypothetical protein